MLRTGSSFHERTAERRADTGTAADAHPRNERGEAMISLPAGSRIWLVVDITDMRNSFKGLTSRVLNVLKDDPYCGHLFIFRGRRGDIIKVLCGGGPRRPVPIHQTSGTGTYRVATRDGKVHLTLAQLSMLLEGISWNTCVADETH